MSLYIVLMAAATFVEKEYGTSVAKSLIYYSPLFILLQLLMIVDFVVVTVRRKLFSRRKWAYMTVHAAMVVILAGAMTTHVFGEEGTLHLREGERSGVFMVRNGSSYEERQLPFDVELIDFELTRYPGSHSPSSYESFLRIYDGNDISDEHVYMNHVLDMKGYRFFQASYDQDEKGSVLSVSYDSVGRSITYSGYVILFVGLVACLVSRNSRFRQALRKLSSPAIVSATLLVVTLILFPSGELKAIDIPKAHAERFGSLPMQDVRGRIVPVSTFASEIVRKLHLDEVLPGYSDEQIILNLLVEPEVWSVRPLLVIEDKGLKESYTDGRSLIAYINAFDENGNYRFINQVEAAYRKMPSERSKTEKELMKLDERINILHQLFGNNMIRLFPDPADTVSHRWIEAADHPLFLAYRQEVAEAAVSGNWERAEAAMDDIAECQTANIPAGLELDYGRLKAESLYNSMDILPLSRKIYLISGGILLLLSFSEWMKRTRRKWEPFAAGILTVAIVAAFLLHTYNMCLRGYISGHAPWSNAYETMVLMSWASVLAGILFSRKNTTVFALSVILGGVVLFVSGLNWMDPEITPLVPVLKSPWLMVHVALLMLSYGFLGLACMISTLNLVAYCFTATANGGKIRQNIVRLGTIVELCLILGEVLLMMGIFIGAVWANESWGRYWSWDPKETWALITAIAYAMVLHVRWFEKKQNVLRFNLMSQLSFLSVLMTYFGVNYLLSGMHSYGAGVGVADIPVMVVVLCVMIFVLPGIASSLFSIVNRKSK